MSWAGLGYPPAGPAMTRIAREMLGRLRRLGLVEEIEGGVVVFDAPKLGDFVVFLGGPGRAPRSTG